jgi:hypothetical protein
VKDGKDRTHTFWQSQWFTSWSSGWWGAPCSLTKPAQCPDDNKTTVAHTVFDFLRETSHGHFDIFQVLLHQLWLL